MMMMMMIPPLHSVSLQTVNYSAALCSFFFFASGKYFRVVFIFMFELYAYKDWEILVLIGWQRKSVDCQLAPFQIATTGFE